MKGAILVTNEAEKWTSALVLDFMILKAPDNIPMRLQHALVPQVHHHKLSPTNQDINHT